MDKQAIIDTAHGLSAFAFISIAVGLPWIISYLAN